MPPRSYSPQPRRSRLPKQLLVGAALVSFVSLGLLGSLWIAGVPLFEDAGSQANPYLIRIPVNAQRIPAYTRVKREQLLDPQTGQLTWQELPPSTAVGMSLVGVDVNGTRVEGRVESVQTENEEVFFVVAGRQVAQSRTNSLGSAILNPSAIVGRVVRSDKRPGLGFQENTFFPRGTPEGIAGATPQGMRAITLDATQLNGVHALGAGDRIDLMANMPLGDDESMTEVQLLAKRAIVLLPVYARSETTSSASLTQGTRLQSVPKYEVALAVEPEDVLRLQDALNQELTLTCIAHSMKPAEEEVAQSEPESTSNLVSVPVTVRQILAYDVVTRDAFVSPATRKLKMESISKQLADRLGVITSLNDALGAVTRYDVPVGSYLRKVDLLQQSLEPSSSNTGALEASRSPRHSHSGLAKQALGRNVGVGKLHLVSMLQESEEASNDSPSAGPVGERPAITRFIPSGYTAFAIPWNRIYGSEHLQIGDRIDLMVSYSLERRRAVEETEKRPDDTVVTRRFEDFSTRATQRTIAESLGDRGEPWFVASDAIVIAPVGFPAPASAMRALAASQSGPSRNDSGAIRLGGPPVIIAVEDRDVETVATALATQQALFSVAFHSTASRQVAGGKNQIGSRANGRREIAISPDSIEAYSALKDDIWHGNRRRALVREVAANELSFTSALTVRELQTYVGRVLRVEKRRGDAFFAEDFLPPGTRPGVTAAVGPGEILVPLSDQQVLGLDLFGVDDQIAIVVQGRDPGSLTSGPAVVVGQARVIQASRGGRVGLAVPQDAVNCLQDALGKTNLVAVGLSRTTDGASGIFASCTDEQTSPLTQMEIIVGGMRRVEVFKGAQ